MVTWKQEFVWCSCCSSSTVGTLEEMKGDTAWASLRGQPSRAVLAGSGLDSQFILCWTHTHPLLFFSFLYKTRWQTCKMDWKVGFLYVWYMTFVILSPFVSDLEERLLCFIRILGYLQHMVNTAENYCSTGFQIQTSHSFILCVLNLQCMHFDDNCQYLFCLWQLTLWGLWRKNTAD